MTRKEQNGQSKAEGFQWSVTHCPPSLVNRTKAGSGGPGVGGSNPPQAAHKLTSGQSRAPPVAGQGTAGGCLAHTLGNREAPKHKFKVLEYAAAVKPVKSNRYLPIGGP